ncbi:hypothetical protein IWX65_002169 [Arthrobacter sp. CAN_A214]
MERAYVQGTNVLTTVYTTAGGSVRVTDSLNTGVAGRLPWGELARRIEGLSGVVPMKWSVNPGNCFQSASPWVEVQGENPILRVDGTALAIRGIAHGTAQAEGRSVSGAFPTSEGSRHLVAVISTHREPVPLPDPTTIDEGIDRTIANWQLWSRNFSYDGKYADEVLRSALDGNPAAGQLQLGVFGDVFDIVWQYVRAGHSLDRRPCGNWPALPISPATSGSGGTPECGNCPRSGTTSPRSWAAGQHWIARSNWLRPASSRDRWTGGVASATASGPGSRSTAGRKSAKAMCGTRVRTMWMPRFCFTP